MVHVPSLWLPILLAAGLVYAASSIIHMFLGYHRKDFGKLPAEDGVMDALRGAPAGDYSFPHPSSRDDLRDEAFREKARRGPTGFLTLSPAGDPFRMGPQLAQWFGYCLIVSAFAGYVTGLTLGPGSGYMEVFRMSSTVAFGAYALAQRTGDNQNPGRESSNCLQGCTICAFCRRTGSCWTEPRKRGNRL